MGFDYWSPVCYNVSMTFKLPIGKTGETTQVDEDIYYELEGKKIHRTGRGGRTLNVMIDGKPILMHRYVMKPWHDEVVHHTDGNTLNNCRANLTCMSKAEHDKVHDGPAHHWDGRHLRWGRYELPGG